MEHAIQVQKFVSNFNSPVVPPMSSNLTTRELRIYTVLLADLIKGFKFELLLLFGLDG